MKTNRTLKILLVLALVLNLAVMVMQIYNTRATINNARSSLIMLGKTALSTFEGGRRAMMALNPQYSDRLKSFLHEADTESAVRSIYLFNEDGSVILNTGGITPPAVTLTGKGIADTDDGIFIYRTLKPRNGGYGMGMGGGFGQGMMNHFPENKSVKLIGAVLIDASSLETVRNSELTFLGAVVLLQLVLGAVFLYTLRLIKLSEDRAKELELRDREAQMGKMSLVMAHELKNPLSTVKGLIEYLAKKSEGAQNDIALRCVDELSRLDRIVNDFLTYGRDLTPETSQIDIFSLTADTAKLLEIDAAQKGISIDLSGMHTTIEADGAKMKQVLFNLLLNAMQASPEHAKISVEVLQHRLKITNKVKNPSFDTEKIGTPFYTTKTVGTGLGIAIVRRILSLHGFGFSIHAGEEFTVEITY